MKGDAFWHHLFLALIVKIVYNKSVKGGDFMPDLNDFHAFKSTSGGSSGGSGGGGSGLSKWIVILIIIALLTLLGECSG